MDSIHRIIAIARGRIVLGVVVEAIVSGLVGASLVAALAMGASKLVPGADWSLALFGALVVVAFAVGGGIVLALRLRALPSAQGLALRVDERLKLEERFITALALERSSDSYARAAVADAVEKANDPALPSKVRAAFPIRVSSHSLWAAALLALAIAGQVYLPAYEWPEAEKPSEPAVLAAKKASEDAIERLKTEAETKSALPQDVKDALAGLAANAEPSVDESPTAEEAKREAIKRMSEFKEKLDEVKKSERAQMIASVKRDLQDLKPETGEAAALAEKLSEGDFEGARKEIDDLAKKLESGEMTEGEKAQARAALEQMSKSIETIANNQASLKEAIEKAGLDSQLASNPEALRQAIEQAANLSDQQREQLKKAVQASKASQDAMKKIAKAANKASQQQKNPGQQQKQSQGQKQGQQQGQQGQQQQGQQGQQQQGQQGQQQQGQQGQQQQSQQQQGQQGQAQECKNPGQQPGGSQSQSGEQGDQQGDSAMQGLSEMSDALSDLEQTQQMLEEAEALSNMAEQESQSLGEGMCKGGQCNNPGSQGGQQSSMEPGSRRGMQGGRAQGGNTGKSKTPTGTKTEKAKTKNAGGDIIARQLIENPNPEKGASVLPAGAAVETAAGGAGAAVSEENVPAHLKEAHKHYFGELKKEITRRSGQDGSGGGAQDGKK